MRVIVECSANHCRFKNNNGYYGVCRNPKQQAENQIFTGARVQVSGCECGSCKLDCGIVMESLPKTLLV